MNQIKGYQQAASYDGTSIRITTGGHVCKIRGAAVEQTDNGTERFVVYLDVCEGSRFDGMYDRMYADRVAKNPAAKWPCQYSTFLETQDGECSPFFKGLISCVEKSNDGYKWNWNEGTLRGKMIGMIFREEEFMGNDGTVKTVIRPYAARSVDTITSGDYEMPEIKRLNKVGQRPRRNTADDNMLFPPPPEEDKLPWEK